MNHSPRAALIALGVVLALETACAFHARPPSSSDRPVYRSSRKVPTWVTQRPAIPGYFVAVGIATAMPSLEEAQQAAVGAAVSEIVTHLGINAVILFTETRTELANQVKDQITARGAARVASGRTVEMYYEERRQSVAGRIERIYDVYVLVVIPDAEIERERKRLREELQAKRALAERLLQEGLEARKRASFEGALLRWIHALEVLEGDIQANTAARQAKIEIARLVDDLEIAAEIPMAPNLPKRVVAHVWLRDGEQKLPLPHLPLRLFSVRGGGVTEERARTDENGVARFAIRSVLARVGPVIVAAGVDVGRLLRSDSPLTRFSSNVVAASLSRLSEKRAEVVLAAEAAFGTPNSGSRAPPLPHEILGPIGTQHDALSPSPSAARRELAAGENPVQITLLPGHDRIYAPRGRPDKCISYVLEIVGLASAGPPRRPMNIALILDASASMQEQGKLEYLKQAAKLMVENLAPYDVFSLITYASEAEVVRPAGSVSDPVLAKHMIDMMRASGTTNLSAGLIEGIRQAENYHGEEMLSRVILVSDGLANKGITDALLLGRYAARAADLGISVTTIGLGQEFDEDLLMTLANEGHGNYYYVDNPDEIPKALSHEMNGLAQVLAQNVTVSLDLDPGVRFLNSLGIPYQSAGRRVTFRVGQVASGERVRLAYQLEVPPGKPGPKRFGSVSVTYDSTLSPGTRKHTVFTLRGAYTENPAEARASERERVNRLVHALAIMDSMLLASKSGSRGAIREVLRYLEQELPALQSWVEERDDQEMEELAQMLQHCKMILSHELQYSSDTVLRNRKDPAKEISYRLYRLRHHPVWETGADER